MFCIACGAENLDSVKFCHKCGKALFSGAGEPTSREPAIEEPTVTNEISESPAKKETVGVGESQKKFTKWHLVRIGFVASWCYLAALSHKPLFGGYFSPEVFGAWVGALTLPVLLTYLLRGRKKPRDWEAITKMFFWLGLFLPALIATYGRPADQNLSRTPAKTRLERLGDEITGKQPVSTTSGDPDEAAVRVYFREVIALNRRYVQESAEYETPEMEMLFEPASFAQQSTIEEIIRQLRGLAELQERTSASQERLMRHLASIRSKEFWQGVEEGKRIRGHVRTLEKKWINTTLDLYKFALRNFESLSVDGEEIYITQSDVLSSFDRKLSAAVESNNAFLLVYQQAEQYQKEQLVPWGISPSDLGIPQQTELPPP